MKVDAELAAFKFTTMIAVLFARSDSVYKQLPNTDVFDIERDARTFTGNSPIVAHPPCRAWGRLKWSAKPAPGEKDLAIFAVNQIRKNGGVLEHPEASKLWDEMSLPKGNEIDEFGGFTLSVDQFWWGHLARKRTWLYIVGIKPSELPPYPICLDAITHTVCVSMRRGRKHFKPKPAMPKGDYDKTPPAFAEYLLRVAFLCARG